MSAPWKVEPLDGGVSSGCLNCGGREAVHPLDGMLGVGFGNCDVTRDGRPVWWEEANSDSDEPMPTLQRFEDMAAADPDHDWRVSYVAPLWSGSWQRHGVGEWNLIDRGMGFA